MFISCLVLVKPYTHAFYFTWLSAKSDQDFAILQFTDEAIVEDIGRRRFETKQVQVSQDYTHVDKQWANKMIALK